MAKTYRRDHPDRAIPREMTVHAEPLCLPASVPPRGLHVVERHVSDLIPHARNPRTHSKQQVRQIADSIQQFGFTNPLLVNGEGRIIAGHGRLLAAQLLGLTTVPTIPLEHLTEAQMRAYVIADNKLAENAGWDRELLALEFQYLDTLDLEFDLTITGFHTGEIDALLGELRVVSEDTEEEAPAPDWQQPAISQPGDLWQIGDHRLLCGDATKSESFAALLGDEHAELVFIDPPYNVPIDGHVSGLGAVTHREFAMASGEMSRAEFTAFLQTTFGHLARHSVDGAIHFVCMDWRHIGEVLAAADGVYAELKNLCVWNKTNAGMGSLYRSKHELVFVFKSGTAPHTNNVELGQYGRYRTNVWDYAGANTFRAERADDLAMHPTVKPIALVADAIQDCSHRGGLVLDCFAGSGTTLLAAERTGRRGYGMELDPWYADLIVRRVAEATGAMATHTPSGLTFEILAAQRRATSGSG